MARAEQVGSGHCSVPPSFDNAHGGSSEAPDPAPSEYSDPRRVLFMSVLEQALSDARLPSARGSGASAALPDDRAEAFKFLLDTHGARARWRRTICGLCGLDIEAFEESVRAESKNWPPLNQLSEPGRRQQYSSRHRSSEGRGDAEKRREASRIAMARKRQRERAQPAKPEPYHRRALLAGSGSTRPTYTD